MDVRDDQSRHIRSHLPPLGPGEQIGAVHWYEIEQVEHVQPTHNMYLAYACDLVDCDGCGNAVTRGTFCGTCGTRPTTDRAVRCRVFEKVACSDSFAAEERIKAAQLHTTDASIVPIYDLFEANDRKYLIFPFVEQADILAAQPWSVVFGWAQQLAGALAWLHNVGVSLNGITPDMLVLRPTGIQIAHLGTPIVFTQDAQGTVITKDIYTLTVTLARLGIDVPPLALRKVLLQSANHRFTSAQAFQAALHALTPSMRRYAEICIDSAMLSDRGRVRDGNEDSVGLVEGTRQHEAGRQQWGLYIISDGMGGHEGGEVASRLVVNSFLQSALTQVVLPQFAGSKAVDWAKATETAVLAAHKAVYDARIRNNSGMGATLIAATLVGTTLTLAHLGDSRAYLWNGERLSQITQDHSLIAQLVASGHITVEEARTHPQRSVLLQSVGDKATVKSTISQHQLQPGQTLMLCSDGLHSMITDAEIETIMARQLRPRATCAALIDAANAAGGDDNISVLVIQCAVME